MISLPYPKNSWGVFLILFIGVDSCLLDVIVVQDIVLLLYELFPGLIDGQFAGLLEKSRFDCFVYCF